MTDVESVKKALAELRDAAETQAGAEEPDLRPVAEAYDKFNSQWVSRKVELNEKEANPESVETEETPVVEDDNKRKTEIKRADGKTVPTTK